MSDDKKSGLGLWLSKKSDGASGSGPITPKNVGKRWWVVVAGVAGFGIVVSSFMNGSNAPPPQREKKVDVVDLTPKGADQKTWQAQSQSDITELKDENAKLAAKLDRLTSALADKDAAAKQAAQAGYVPPPVMPGTTSPQQMPTLPAVVPPPPPPTQPTTTINPSLPPVDSLPHDIKPVVFKAEKRDVSKPATDALGNAIDSVKAKVAYRKNPYSGFLPAGAFSDVALLNGLDAGTASMNQSNPQPILMQIQNNAVLPGSASYRLKSCFILGSGYGDLSAERVYVRLARLSCVDKANKLILTSQIGGYLVDSDGKLGLRGTVVDRQGARLGKALLAGFAQGLAGALGTAQGTTTNSVFGSTNSLDGTAALRASGLTGAQTASSQLAQFYLKEAEAIFPVITVDAGRVGTVVFTEGTSLEWGQGDTNFTKEVKPDGQ
ncbi:hypothetical protein F6X40_10520 [Paraburkholderia sp. UCT31]|uniref:TraB/VirB10 family protein n=1 Tax=Paraburkholderia sp. UCT31 TaxID=2615209 RepID=UPI001654E5CA|nr:TraB/VirB10 family protein [Paraburkholderia sp. UCT31]MBC8737241.1 hypothetical protein [Paraburkholderia sp. UCT31]